MIKKTSEKTKAIQLRREGKSYSDILKIVPVAKSSLSLWLKEVGLSNTQKQTLTSKKLASAKRGGLARRQQRVEKYTTLLGNAKAEVGKISGRELHLIGAVLYWAEGNKEKEFHPGSQLMFSNMDSKMILVFLRFLKEIYQIPNEMIHFEIYIHKTHEYRLKDIKKYWVKNTGFPLSHFNSVYIKNNVIKTTNRRNVTKEGYFGSLRIKVRTSSDYVRKLAGWAEGIYDAVN